VRRTGTQSATEKLIRRSRLDKDPRLALVARLGHVWEITPWAYATDVEVKDLSLRCRRQGHLQPRGGRVVRPSA